MAELIRANGEIVEVSPAKGRKFKLDELQAFVGGYIELVNLPRRMVLVVNEEGLIRQLPLNKRATLLCEFRHTIVGDVLFCRRGEV